MATYNIDNLPSRLSSGDVINCPYSGSIKSLTLPAGSYTIECWGAEGGSPSSTYPAYGGYVHVSYTISNPTTLYCVCGGAGKMVSSGTGSGGYNGGGSATATTSYPNGSGGGATHVALLGGLLSTFSSLRSALIAVAGGGGGRMDYSISSQNTYGKGGGTTGGGGAKLTRNSPSYSSFVNAGGGSQSAGGNAGSFYMNSGTRSGSAGSFGQGGAGYTSSGNGGTGGGGGLYGGGGGAAYWVLSLLSVNALAATAGGGSGYIGTGSGTHIAGATNNPDSDGDGYIRITVNSVTYDDGVYVKENGNWIAYSKVYKKINGSWIEQSATSDIIESGTTLIKGN